VLLLLPLHLPLQLQLHRHVLGHPRLQLVPQVRIGVASVSTQLAQNLCLRALLLNSRVCGSNRFFRSWYFVFCGGLYQGRVSSHFVCLMLELKCDRRVNANIILQVVGGFDIKLIVFLDCCQMKVSINFKIRTVVRYGRRP
jgi:hypothetical protein